MIRSFSMGCKPNSYVTPGIKWLALTVASTICFLDFIATLLNFCISHPLCSLTQRCFDPLTLISICVIEGGAGGDTLSTDHMSESQTLEKESCEECINLSRDRAGVGKYCRLQNKQWCRSWEWIKVSSPAPGNEL